MEKAINRQRVLLDHLRPSSSSHNFESTLSASACLAGDSAAYQRTSAYGDDVVIVAAYRTPQCKSKRGGFKDTHADDLLAPVLKALIEKTNLGPREVGDIVVGSELAPGSQRASECRMAAFYAGSPETVPIRTVNRQCSSGLQAVADVAASIKAGFYEIGIGAGLESMTINQMSWDGDVNAKLKNFQKAQDCLLPMGITSENVAHRFGVTRQEQDQAAVDSHRKAAAATASGRFKDEIIPVATKIVDPKTGDEKPIVVSVDDGIRPETSVAGLGKLKTVFKKDGTTTAGNSSQISDGAGAVLLMKRSVAVQKGLPILGVFRTFAAVGVDPAIMGVGPAVAIPAAVKAAGLELEDIDLVEVNEMDYINTSHPNFIGGSKAVENAQQQIKSSKGSLAMPRQKDGIELEKAPASERSMKTRGILARQGVRPVAEVEKVPPAGNTNVSSWGISSIFGGGDHSRMYAKENSTSKSYNELAQCIEPLEQSLSLIHLREPPTVLRPSENHSEHESIEIVVTKLLLRSYFDIVRKNIEDSIPKAIMHFLVNHTKRELHNVFIRKLYRENLFEEMLQEPDEIAMKRKQTREQLRVLQQAFRVVELQ